MQKILVIQTAFIGDAILATGILEKLHSTYPNAAIDFMVRNGNESLFTNHPFLNNVIVWNKKKGKYKTLFALLKQVRQTRYDVVINVQRFAATGFLTAFSKAKMTIGFDKNPLSSLFSIKVKHIISNATKPLHEIERNQMLIESIASGNASKPKLYPSKHDDDFVSKYKYEKYVCIAPASVWFTKQFPTHKWVELLNAMNKDLQVYLIGAPTDISICQKIILNANHKKTENLAGKLTLLESTSLIRDAQNNYVNDSAPMHLASAVNAATTAIYCSTLPSFGFGPLSINSYIIEQKETLNCRPCGLHGRKECPQKHFNCANLITASQILN